MLLSAQASDLDVDCMFTSHPLATGLPADALDATLAAILGYRYAGSQPEIANALAVRGHQRYYGDLAARWLGRRLGWA